MLVNFFRYCWMNIRECILNEIWKKMDICEFLNKSSIVIRKMKNIHNFLLSQIGEKRRFPNTSVRSKTLWRRLWSCTSMPSSSTSMQSSTWARGPFYTCWYCVRYSCWKYFQQNNPSNTKVINHSKVILKIL